MENTSKTVAESPRRPFVYSGSSTPRQTQQLDSCGDKVAEGDILQYDGTISQIMQSQLMIVVWDAQAGEWCFRSSINPYMSRFGACGGLRAVLRHCVRLGNIESNPELFTAIELASTSKNRVA